MHTRFHGQNIPKLKSTNGGRVTVLAIVTVLCLQLVWPVPLLYATCQRQGALYCTVTCKHSTLLRDRQLSLLVYSLDRSCRSVVGVLFSNCSAKRRGLLIMDRSGCSSFVFDSTPIRLLADLYLLFSGSVQLQSHYRPIRRFRAVGLQYWLQV